MRLSFEELESAYTLAQAAARLAVEERDAALRERAQMLEHLEAERARRTDAEHAVEELEKERAATAEELFDAPRVERLRCIDELLGRAGIHLCLARRDRASIENAIELAGAAFECAYYLAIGLDTADAIDRLRWPSLNEWSDMAREACGLAEASS
jgi:hypothetical protein